MNLSLLVSQRLQWQGKTLIIDAKYYQKSMAAFMGKQMLYSANLYQIYTYVKNLDKGRSGNVSGMLLYAKTTEDIIPSMKLPIGGNIISAKTLDLNNEFQMISNTLDTIVQNNFGENLKKTA